LGGKGEYVYKGTSVTMLLAIAGVIL